MSGLKNAITYANYQLWIFAVGGALLWVLLPAKASQGPPRALYQLAVDVDPDFALGHRVLAEAFERDGRTVEALDHYRAALAAEPFDHSACLGRGRAAAKLGHLDEALEALRCATAHDPTRAEAWGRLGAALQAKGASAEAGDAFRRALRLDPNDDQSRLGLGVNAAAAGRLDEAQPLLELAEAHLPNDPDAAFNLALLYKLRKQPERALPLFTRTVALDPHHEAAWRNVVELELALRRVPDARAALQAWLAAEPGNPNAQAMLDGLPPE